MAHRLSDSMVVKLQQRAADSAVRSDSGSLAANSTPADGMMSVLGSLFGGHMMMIGGEIVGGAAGESKPAPPPCSEQEVAAAEAELGFAVPDDLRRFYLEVADGGVGPGDGLLSLDELVAKWREMTHEPVGPRGQVWPLNLLPIQGHGWDLACFDLETGAITCFDAEELEHGGWSRAFKRQADNLETWLGEWLEGGGAHQSILDEMTAAKARWAEEEIAKLESRSEAHRASHGYVGDDWRNEVRRRFGAPLR